MKIKKFNESNNIYENNNAWSLLFYKLGGTADKIITFNNESDAINYTLNLINNFILNDDFLYKENNPVKFFTDCDVAIDWYNEYVLDGEPTLDLIKSRIENNIEFDSNIQRIMDTNKYNL